MCEQFKSSVSFLAKSGSVSRVLSSGRARGGKMKPKVWTDSGNGLHAALNKLDVILLTFGAMLGWGWVILTGEWILSAGAFGAAAAFVLGGIFVSFVSLVYAELSSAMPNSLGVIGFCRRAFGTRISFLCGWAVILTFLSVISFETVAFPNVFAYLFPDILSGYLYSAAGFEIHAPWLLIGVGSSLLICAVNYRGVRTAALLQTVLMAVILLAGILLAGGTVVNGKPENLFPLFSNGPHGVLTVVVMTPFIYSGFDVIPHAAEEMNIPPRKIGQLLVLSVGLAVIWYVSIILCVSCTLSRQQIASSALPTADAMAAAFGRQHRCVQTPSRRRSGRNRNLLERLLYRRQPYGLCHVPGGSAPRLVWKNPSKVPNPFTRHPFDHGAHHRRSVFRCDRTEMGGQRGQLRHRRHLSFGLGFLFEAAPAGSPICPVPIRRRGGGSQGAVPFCSAPSCLRPISRLPRIAQLAL